MEEKHVDFTVMGLDPKMSDYLNWCIEWYDNLCYIKEDQMFEHFGDKEKGSAELYFVKKAVLMSINKSILSHRKF